MPKVSPVPAMQTSAASMVQPCSSTTAESVATVPTTPSPSTMMAKRQKLGGDVYGHTSADDATGEGRDAARSRCRTPRDSSDRALERREFRGSPSSGSVVERLLPHAATI